MDKAIKTFDDMPLWLKIILALPALDIVWVIYRLLRSVKASNVIGIVLAVLLIIVGIPFLWLVDIISLAVAQKVFWID